MGEHKDAKPPQASLLLRILGGGYLVYLAYDLLTSGTRTPLITVAAFLFFVVGGALAVLSLRSLLTSEYFRNTPQKEEPVDSEELEDEQ